MPEPMEEGAAVEAAARAIAIAYHVADHDPPQLHQATSSSLPCTACYCDARAALVAPALLAELTRQAAVVEAARFLPKSTVATTRTSGSPSLANMRRTAATNPAMPARFALLWTPHDG